MNETWINNPSIHTELSTLPPAKPPAVVGSIKMDYTKGNEYTEMGVDDPDITEVSKLDYVNPEYLDPVNMYMNWHKRHPEGQWGPMKSDNKMVSYERKNNIKHKV